jgi:Flp pilus assembly protein TadG
MLNRPTSAKLHRADVLWRDPQRQSRLRARRGAVALEFAILAVPLLILALGAMEIGYDYFVQARLDDALETAARSVQVGTDVGQPGHGQSLQFVRNDVCPALGGLLNCDNLYVSITAVPTNPALDFYDYMNLDLNPTLATVMASQDVVCTGVAKQLMVAQAFYLGPSFLGSLIPTFSNNVNGTLTHISYATTGFINENFSGGENGC